MGDLRLNSHDFVLNGFVINIAPPGAQIIGDLIPGVKTPGYDYPAPPVQRA